jgi:cysteine-rich repeat protein
MIRALSSVVLVSLACATSMACTSPASDDGGFTFSASTTITTTVGDGDGDPTAETGDTGSSTDAGVECGNAVPEPGEECDLGAENSDTGVCTSSCKIAICGDGLVYEGFEECDDANSSNTDDCVTECKTATCGDAFVQQGVETCDDGNDDPADGCNSMCLPGACGDGIVQEGEQCDDGDDDTTDECPACQIAFCGDGFLQAGIEECDDGNQLNTDACLPTFCTPAFCGDGFLMDGVEECDDGNLDDEDMCPTSCIPAFCGDGFHLDGVEECDDGNNLPDDACTPECIALCGDDCFSEFGCFTPEGRCIKLSCRPGNAGPDWCDSCMGWEEITYDQWLNDGYCGDIIAVYRTLYDTTARCGNASCCDSDAGCTGGDAAWHFHDGVSNHYVGPCLSCPNNVACTHWNGVDNSTYTRLSACERF